MQSTKSELFWSLREYSSQSFTLQRSWQLIFWLETFKNLKQQTPWLTVTFCFASERIF